MSKIRSIVAAQSSVGEPEHRGDERSEAARSGGSPTFEPDVVPVVPDSEVPARHARRRFTTAYKLDILRRADACGGHGELGQLLRAEGLYPGFLISLWYLTARTSRRALISGAPTQGTSLRRVTPGG